MDKDEREWIEAAMAECSRATEKGLTIMIVRRQDADGGHDVVLTNCVAPPVLEMLVRGISPYNTESSD